MSATGPDIAATGARSRRLWLVSPDAGDDPDVAAEMRRLAACLAADGHGVMLLMAPPCRPIAAVPSPPPPGVRLVDCPVPAAPVLQGQPSARRAYHVLARLKDEQADLVLAPEAGGIAFYLAAARRAGWPAGGARLVTVCLGPGAQLAEADGALPAGHDALARDHMERCSLAWSDAAVFASRPLQDWLQAEDWRLPRRHAVLAPPMPPCTSPMPPRGAVEEIIFAGGLRRGDGLVLFVDALRRLPAGLLARLRVTLLGRRAVGEGSWDPSAWLATAMPAGLAWREEAPGDDAALVARLAAPGGLVVVGGGRCAVPPAARLCLLHGIPFLAPDAPALRMAIDPRDAGAVLAPPVPAGLALALQRAIDRRPAAARPAAGPPDWGGFVAQQLCVAPPAPAILPRDAAEVSVVLVHRNRPAQLAEAIAGLHRQTLGGFEVVLVDDGSDAPAALAALESLAPDFAARGWRILRGPNAWLGAARNRGWRAARGRYVLFHDDDNIAMPQQIARLLGAAQASGAAVVTSLLAPFEGAVPQDPTRLLLALGGAVALGAYVNCFGDAGALVRRDVLEALGGFTEDWGLGHEDWEFFARAALAGHEVLALPEAVFWYRIAPDSMLRTRPDDRPDHRRSLRAYTAPLPPVLRPAVLAALADAMALAGARAQAAAARQAAEARHGRILEQRRMIETQAQRLAELREALQARARRIATLQEELAAQKRMIAALRGTAGRPATPPPRAGSAVAPPADPGRPDDAET